MKDNPYRLARDIRGIGFLSADTIAQKVGIALDSPLRAQAGVSYALAEASAQGHCGLPHAELVPLAVELLKIPGEIIERAIDQEIADEVLMADTVDQQPCVFLAPLYQAEALDRRPDQAPMHRQARLAGSGRRHGHPVGGAQAGDRPSRQSERRRCLAAEV